MSLPVHLLTTVADCEQLLLSQRREHARLTNRLRQLDYQLRTWESPENLEATIAFYQKLTEGLSALVPVTPAGPERLRRDNERLRAAIRLNRLLLRAENRGRRARLERELARAQVQASLTLLEAFLDGLETQRAALLAAEGTAPASAESAQRPGELGYDELQPAEAATAPQPQVLPEPATVEPPATGEAAPMARPTQANQLVARTFSPRIGLPGGRGLKARTTGPRKRARQPLRKNPARLIRG